MKNKFLLLIFNILIFSSSISQRNELIIFSEDNQAFKKHTSNLIKLIRRRDNFSSMENCNNITEKLYQRGYSALDIMKIIENDNKIPKKEKYTALIYFDKIRKEFRNEKLLMLLIFYKFFMRKDINLENIDEM